jgi:hypothetical protein
MDTMMELGSSSVEFEVTQFNHANYVECERSIRNWLELQPGSLEPMFTVEDILALIAHGRFFGWILIQDNLEIGIVLFSIQQYPRAKVLKIEFLSCQNFHDMAGIWDYFEQQARDAGYDYIEAVTHPTIARYAMRKVGFTIPSVYIRKAVKHMRRQ